MRPLHKTAVLLKAASLAALLSACAGAPPQKAAELSSTGDEYALANRLTWGANSSAVNDLATQGVANYLHAQLHPPAARLDAEVSRQIDGLTISEKTLPELIRDLDQRRKDADANSDDDKKKSARQAYQQDLNRLAREAASRHVLRALYSPNQIQEQMTWFWLNHFSVHQGKGNLRAMVGDYEDSAIRPHALGKFRDLLGAVATHPAMLRYLDNEQNAAGRINENFARELMELHTLGVDAGYSQRDVQELARVLTGVGVNLSGNTPGMRKDLQGFYVRRGLFEFNPARHDFGDKTLLGQTLKTHGLKELDEALDRLATHPATAQFICRKLATYWLADEPPGSIVQRMAQTFQASHGDIASTLETLFNSAEFTTPQRGKFKDPMRYVMSSVRLAYDRKVILNVGPILNWLNRMGEPLYGHLTPDGYPLSASAWSSSGQMTTRFEIAKAIGSGNAGLFKSEGPQPQEKAAFPQLANALYFSAISRRMSPATAAALDQATSPQEWNTLLLSSPEMMFR
ncbi:DUF1800 domain-containing protein [Roseateles koreensis]|uniref:DUF1800 domain-containing protein n=1 Tax=Roseateles koreensis TaxID=2987526 RepID=A0ABT5KU71_9BURK|nr:DUF1800 domain-containing protein [Roseateles koreensis]MDC8785903.1 DUF1800 domain-containing protein [Roseateles koreensis]